MHIFYEELKCISNKAEIEVGKKGFSLQKTFNKLMYTAVVCTLPVTFLKVLKNVTGSF